jgi:Insect cuticle protein
MLAVAFAEPPAPRSSYLPPQSRNSFGSQPSSQYGAPSAQAGRSSFAQQPRTNYGAPSQNQQPRNTYNAPAQQPRTNYGAPQQQQPSSNYGAPAQQPNSNYGAPAQQQPSSNYGAPAQQQPNSNYGPPSTSYGVPSAQDFNGFDSQRANSYQQAPSSAYGAPGQGQGQDSYSSGANGYSSGANGGYEEPAKYEFQYDVQDEQAGLDFGHKEQRDGSVATGRYYVLLPDGRKQVNYSLEVCRIATRLLIA